MADDDTNDDDADTDDDDDDNVNADTRLVAGDADEPYAQDLISWSTLLSIILHFFAFFCYNCQSAFFGRR
jgi:hypothetical protein